MIVVGPYVRNTGGGTGIGVLVERKESYQVLGTSTRTYHAGKKFYSYWIETVLEYVKRTYPRTRE